jgi:hypothetical protein
MSVIDAKGVLLAKCLDVWMEPRTELQADVVTLNILQSQSTTNNGQYGSQGGGTMRRSALACYFIRVLNMKVEIKLASSRLHLRLQKELKSYLCSSYL